MPEARSRDPDRRSQTLSCPRNGHIGRQLAALVLAGVGAACLSGCTLTAVSDAGTEPVNAFDEVRGLDLSPRQVAGGGTSGPGGGVRAQVYYGAQAHPAAADTGSGEGGFFGAGAAGAEGTALPEGVEESADGVSLDFENTPISAVAKVVLGDLLHAGYVIDPRVQGSISLSTSRKIAKADLLLVLETALRSANAALVRERGFYRIVPSEDAIGSGATQVRTAEPGYGVTVIPLRYVSVPAILKLVDGFAAKAGAVRGEPSANLVVVTGTAAERQSVLDTVKSFDADFMRGQSVAIFPVRNTTPEPVISELEKIFDAGENGLGHGLVKVQPIARLNAILVVAKKPELVQRAGSWIERLDGSAVSATGVKVYKVRYGEARQLAGLLGQMFTGAGRGGVQEGAELAPGSGATSSAAFGGLSGAGTGAQSGFGQSGFGGGTGQSGFGGTGQSGSGAGQSGFGQSGAGQGGFGQSGAGQSGFGQGGLGGEDQQPYGSLRAATAQEGAATGGVSAGAGGGAAGGAGGAALLPGVRILPDTVNNALLIYANPSSYKLIERTLQQLDRPQLQVAIEVTFAEVTLNDTLQYGVQFFLGSTDLGLGFNQGYAVNSAVSTSAIPPQPLPNFVPGGASSPGGFNLVFGNALTPRAVINALHRFTDVRILSNPSLVVVNNQVATLRVGDQVPVASGQVTSGVGGAVLPGAVQTFEYRDTGVILNVRPRINSNGNVFLQVEQEISNLAAAPSGAGGNPTFSQRRVRSAIVVASGQTVLLAGLIANTQSRARDGIPILEQLPIVGDAFSPANNKAISPRTELIIFIRPQVIRDGVDASYVAEELRSKIRGDKIGSLRPLGAIQPDPPPALMK
jgi:general secretion pathway protein D